MSNFQLSNKFILDPAGISHDNLSTIMNKIHNKNIDYADLYFQYSKNEFWSLEDGKLKMEVTPLIKELELEVSVMKKLHLLIRMIFH